MPKLGMDMVEGRVTRWLVREGTSVGRGDPVVEVETDKTLLEIVAEEAGVLSRILAPAETTVEPGDVLGVISLGVDR